MVQVPAKGRRCGDVSDGARHAEESSLVKLRVGRTAGIFSDDDVESALEGVAGGGFDAAMGKKAGEYQASNASGEQVWFQ